MAAKQVVPEGFSRIVQQCAASGLVDGRAMAADGDYLPANVSRESWKDVEIEVKRSMQSYLDCLGEELAEQPGFRKPPVRTIKSATPPLQQTQTVGMSIMEQNVVLTT